MGTSERWMVKSNKLKINNLFPNELQNIQKRVWVDMVTGNTTGWTMPVELKSIDILTTVHSLK